MRCWRSRRARISETEFRLEVSSRALDRLISTSGLRYGLPVWDLCCVCLMAIMEAIDFIPLVKAYPALSRKYGEVSCVAGVEMAANGPRWIRLYPVPFRSLDDDRQFRKYQPVHLRVEAHRGDLRPETRRPDRDSIELRGGPVSSKNGWALRRRFVEPLMVESMCEVSRRQRRDGTSLGVFRPGQIADFKIEKASVDEEKRQIARRGPRRRAFWTAWGQMSAPTRSASWSRSRGPSGIAINARWPAARATVSRSSIRRFRSSIDACGISTTGVIA